MKLGACVGTVTPALAQLNLQWSFGVGANSMSDEFKNQSYEFVPLTFESDPAVQALNWERFLTWENYGHYWLVGNEPCGAWDNFKPASEVAAIFVRQMDYVLGFDADAKFILTCGTQGQLPYQWHNKNAPLVGELWRNIPKRLRKKIRGFHMHIYPRWVSDDPTQRWNAKYFVRYVKGLRRWMGENGAAGREIWVSEFGFEGYFADDANEYARCAQYVKDVLTNKFLNKNVTRLAFYVANTRTGTDGSNGYCPLLDENGALTDLGKLWSAAA